ncbi:hypothetical protein LCGC14_0912290 [marine sediment metagenome]|uniref:Uncharacterized protein n=1 Tax=marine sediment metagenome TaxID=412755 RepID=A0A0F9PE20_9ZZZZ
MKLKKGKIVYAESQDYGSCIIQLVNKITENVKGKKLKSPIWISFILDSSNDRSFTDFLLKRLHTPGFFEDYDKRNYILELDAKEINSEEKNGE